MTLLHCVMALATSRRSRTLHKVSFSSPSGLLIVDHVDSVGSDQHISLLQHNTVSLRPEYCRAKELKYALSPKECAKVIAVAEEYALNNGGWTSSRHTHYATTDIPIDALLGEDNYIDEMVNSNILPELAAFFQLNLEQLHIGGTSMMYLFYVTANKQYKVKEIIIAYKCVKCRAVRCKVRIPGRSAGWSPSSRGRDPLELCRRIE